VLLTNDPRPELTDHEQWTELLRLASLNSRANEPLGSLNGIRCMGARLVRQAHSYRVVPGPGPEYDREEYKADRAKYLLPHKAVLSSLLVILAEGEL